MGSSSVRQKAPTSEQGTSVVTSESHHNPSPDESIDPALAPPVPVPTWDVPRQRLDLTSAFNAGPCEGCIGCDRLLSQGDGKGSSGDAAVVAEVEQELEVMSAWERIGSVHAWNQVGRQALEKQEWDTAGDAYVRALAYAQAVSYHGPLISAAAAWAPTEMQQNEVQRLCGEVYVGMASLQLQRVQASAETGAEEKKRLLCKAEEAATRALELDSQSNDAHGHLELARKMLDGL